MGFRRTTIKSNYTDGEMAVCNLNQKYVVGHKKLVGSALMRALTALGYRNPVTRTHAELDLAVREDVAEFFPMKFPMWYFSRPPRWEAFMPTIPTPPSSFTRTSPYKRTSYIVLEAQCEASIVSRLFLHLPARLPEIDQRRSSPHGSPGTHQSSLCIGQDFGS
jgi:hypothetical protein